MTKFDVVKIVLLIVLMVGLFPSINAGTKRAQFCNEFPKATACRK